MKLNPERVDLVRRRLGLSKIELAAKLCVDRKKMQRFEAGSHELDSQTLAALTSLSGYPEQFFYKGTPELPPTDG